MHELQGTLNFRIDAPFAPVLLCRGKICIWEVSKCRGIKREKSNRHSVGNKTEHGRPSCLAVAGARAVASTLKGDVIAQTNADPGLRRG